MNSLTIITFSFLLFLSGMTFGQTIDSSMTKNIYKNVSFKFYSYLNKKVEIREGFVDTLIINETSNSKLIIESISNAARNTNKEEFPTDTSSLEFKPQQNITSIFNERRLPRLKKMTYLIESNKYVVYKYETFNCDIIPCQHGHILTKYTSLYSPKYGLLIKYENYENDNIKNNEYYFLNGIEVLNKIENNYFIRQLIQKVLLTDVFKGDNNNLIYKAYSKDK